MALIQCRECGQMISDQAHSCPKCGCPVNSSVNNTRLGNNSWEDTQFMGAPDNEVVIPPLYYTETPQEKSGSNKVLYVVVAILALLVIAGILLLFLNNKGGEDVKKTERKQPKKESVTVKRDTVVVKDTVIRHVEVPKLQAAAPPVTDFRNASYLIRGKIDTFGISMRMKVENGNITGTYHYDKNPTNNNMTIYGYVEQNGELHIEEYSPNGKNSGCFNGSFDGSIAYGTFKNYSKDSELSFNLNVVSSEGQ